MKKSFKLFLILSTFIFFIGCSDSGEEIVYNRIKKEYKIPENKDKVLDYINTYLEYYPNSEHKEEILKIKEEIIDKEKNDFIDELKNNFFEKKIEKEYFDYKINIYKEKYGEDEKINKLLIEISEFEKKEKEEYENKIKDLKSKIYSKYDEFDKINWIYSKDNKNNKITHNEKIYIYGGSKQKDSVFPEWYRIVFKYIGSDYIFFDRVIILVDDIKFDYGMDYFKIERDLYYSGVTEYVDVKFDNESLAEAIEKCKEIKIRFTGKYTKDLKLSQSEIEKLKNILKVYNFQKQNNIYKN